MNTGRVGHVCRHRCVLPNHADVRYPRILSNEKANASQMTKGWWLGLELLSDYTVSRENSRCRAFMPLSARATYPRSWMQSINLYTAKNIVCVKSSSLLDTRKERFCWGIYNFAGYRSENNLVGILKIMSKAAKNFDILASGLIVLHNYFDSSTKLLFWSVSS